MNIEKYFNPLKLTVYLLSVMSCLLAIPAHINAAEGHYLEKVEPVLWDEIEGMEEGGDDDDDSQFNVIIYLSGPDITDQITEIKQRHDVSIVPQSQQLAAIARAKRGDQSLTKQEEIALSQELMAMPLSYEELDLASQLDSKLGAKRKEIGEAFENAHSTVQSEISNIIEINGGSVVSQVYLTNALGAEISGTLLKQLAEHPQVDAILKDIPTKFELDVSVPSVGFEKVWTKVGGPFALTNGNRVWDFGIPEALHDHIALTEGHKMIKRPGSINPPFVKANTHDSHGNHVTGIVASEHSTYRGGAPNIDSIVWGFTGGFAVAGLSDVEWMAYKAEESPEVINLSVNWGPLEFDYDSISAFVDMYSHDYGILVTKSAGNSSWGEQLTTLTRPATAYNIMVVAAMDDNNTPERNDDVRWEGRYGQGSSTGPTPGNRRKPDITAPGANIKSAVLDDKYDNKSGTSMAAPHVAAAAILLHDTGNIHPRSQKAVLINTAEAWSSNDTSSTDDDGQVYGSHWDKSYGWGYLDVESAYNHGMDFFDDIVIPNHGENGIYDNHKLYAGPMHKYDKATLVWEIRTDASWPARKCVYSPLYFRYQCEEVPTVVAEKVNVLLPDLDLFLYDGIDGSLDDKDDGTIDNVHQVSASENITAVIKVTNESIYYYTPNHPEDYSLATEEGFERVNPPSFNIALSPDDPATQRLFPGDTFVVTAQVTNVGDVASFDNKIELKLPNGLSFSSSSNHEVSLGTINANSTKTAEWTVQSSNGSSTYKLEATNSSSSYGELYEGYGSSYITILQRPVSER